MVGLGNCSLPLHYLYARVFTSFPRFGSGNISHGLPPDPQFSFERVRMGGWVGEGMESRQACIRKGGSVACVASLPFMGASVTLE